MSSASFIVQETKRQLVLALELRRLSQTLATESPRVSQNELQTILSHLLAASLLPFGNDLWTELAGELSAGGKQTIASTEPIRKAFSYLQKKVSTTTADLSTEGAFPHWQKWLRDYQQALVNRTQKVPPLPPVPTLDEVQLVKLWRLSALALLHWEEWQNRLTAQVFDSRSQADADWLAAKLQDFSQALDNRRRTRTRGFSDEWNHLYDAIDHLAQAFKYSVLEYQRRSKSERVLRSPAIDQQLTVIKHWIDAEFLIPRRLLLLARELERHGIKAIDFLTNGWEEPLRVSADSIPESPGLQPLAIVRAVLGRLDHLSLVNQFSGGSIHAAATDFSTDVLRDTTWRPSLEFEYVPGSSRTEETLTGDGRQQIGLKLVQLESRTEHRVRDLVWRRLAPAVHLRRALEQGAKALQSPCPTAARKCSELAAQLEGYHSLEKWLSDGDRQARGLLVWELVQLADLHGLHVEHDNDVAAQFQAVLSCLEKHGQVKLERRDVDGDASAPPVWMTFNAGPAQDVLGQTRLLRKSGTYVTLPGDPSQEMRPAAFAIVETTAANREILKFWEEAQGLLLELRLRQPAASIWQKFDDWFIASLLAVEVDLSALQQAFVGVYRMRRNAESPVKELATQLALRIRILLEKASGAPILPSLVPPPSLTPSKAQQQPESVKLKWIRHKESAGAVLKIESFAWEDNGALATVSGGPELADDIVDFFQLAAPRSPRAFDNACQDFRAKVEQRCRRAEELPEWVGEMFLEMTRSMRESKDASVWNEWMHLVCYGPDDEDNQCRRRWCRILTQGHRDTFYPRWDPERQEVHWPIEETTAARQIAWRFSELPLGVGVSPDQVQFAFSADAAAGTFSLGPEAEGGVLLNLESLQTLSDSPLQDEAPLLARHLRTLVNVERNRELRRRKDLPGVNESPLKPLADCLNELSRCSEFSPATRDEILRHLRAVANYHGGRIFPADWSYLAPESSQVTPVYQFAENQEPAGFDAAFALQIGPDRWGEARVTRVVGPAPEGWKELCIAKDALPPQIASAAGALLQTWPYASYDRDLVQAVVGAHIAWWDNLREESWAADEKASKAFQNALKNVLTLLKLNVWTPKKDYISNPLNYLEVVERRPGNGTDPVTVYQVKRPGILDEQRNVVLCTASVIISE